VHWSTLVVALAGVAASPPPKPVKVVLRPYAPPKLEPEPPLEPPSTKVIEVTPQGDDPDTLVLARPWSSPMVGAAVRGARLPVRGELHARGARGCPTRLWYALEPFGYLCSKFVRPTAKPPTAESVLRVADGDVVPFRYVMVGVKDGTFLPMWATLADLQSGAEPERQLKKGDTIAVRPKLEHVGGTAYYISVDDKAVPVQGTFVLTSFSRWQGVVIDDKTVLPFGWITPERANVLDAPSGGKKIDQIAKRERVDILEEQKIGSRRMLRIGEGRWVSADAVNEVRKIERPKGTGTHPQWFDVDLGEQVVVAYDGDKPVYATLTASGREPNHTPRGNYPLWGKVSAITMKSQLYDDVPYYVNKVPWVLFFQAHNALHGAYWHDRFGVTKSHGCVNLSPLDARHMFEWLQPALPAGWTGLRFQDLMQSPVVHVHNSHKRPDWVQERNIGPPDKGDEAERLDQAVARREAKEREEEAAATTSPTTTQTPPTPSPAIPNPLPANPPQR
jgi:hypothetical protein